jgi:hypothetical protein
MHLKRPMTREQKRALSETGKKKPKVNRMGHKTTMARNIRAIVTKPKV